LKGKRGLALLSVGGLALVYYLLRKSMLKRGEGPLSWLGGP
jgi:hypothetical protein